MNVSWKVVEPSRKILIDGGPAMAPIFNALAKRGAVVDTEMYTRAAWERLPYVERCQRSLGVSSNLFIALPTARAMPTIVCLSRTGRRFTEADAQSAARIGRALALADNSSSFSKHEASAFVSLTQRQKQIATLVGEGCSNAQIAELCGISANTARNHLATIFERLGVSTRTELGVQLARMR
jgi:DNA-binding CsgD family transcriptional regulator